jgi:hypothetical protein
MTVALIEILDIKSTRSSPILAHHLDFPKPESQSDVYAIDIGGWVVGRDIPVVAVKVTYEDRHICTIPVSRPRPGVATLHPTAPGVDTCGFRKTVGVLGMAPKFCLQLQAVLQNESLVPLAVISGRCQPLVSDFQPALQPIMVTSLGRTGTTWLMRLLAEHDKIVAYGQYPYEMHAARYFMHMLKVLSEPADHRHASQINTFHNDMAQISANPFYAAPFLQNPQLHRWFGQSYPEQLAAFCQQSIESFYSEVANSQGKDASKVLYFAEKHTPDHVPELTWELYPQAREIFLVRDFRDMICSILAFNAKRGYVAFGRERATDDKQYIRKQRHSALRLFQNWERRKTQAHLVRYEDLVLHPIETLESLYQYLDLDPAPTTINEVLQRASQTTSEMQQHQTSAAPQASIGRWQTELDAPLQEACEEAFGDILAEFNYC